MEAAKKNGGAHAEDRRRLTYRRRRQDHPVGRQGHRSTITISNVNQSNGVIHVVDTVLLPG